MADLVHAAGEALAVSQDKNMVRIRQRCSWCGAVIIDQSVSHEFAASPWAFPIGADVVVTDAVAMEIDTEEHRCADCGGLRVHPSSCMQLDVEITGHIHHEAG